MELYSFSKEKRAAMPRDWALFYHAHTERFQLLHDQYKVQETDREDPNYWYHWLRYSLIMADRCVQALRRESRNHKKTYADGHFVLDMLADLRKSPSPILHAEVCDSYIGKLQELDASAAKIQEKYMRLTGQSDAEDASSIYKYLDAQTCAMLSNKEREAMERNRRLYADLRQELRAMSEPAEGLMESVQDALPFLQGEELTKLRVAQALLKHFCDQVPYCEEQLEQAVSRLDLPPIPPRAYEQGEQYDRRA